MTAEHNPTEDVTSVSPGAMLQEAREKENLSVDHVASELRMTPRRVQAVEEDDFERLPAQTFVRGYLRSYAKLVKLDPEEVLAAYRAALINAGVQDDSEVSPLEIKISRPRRPLWHFGIWLLVLLAALWLGSLWFVNNRSEAPETLGSNAESLPESTGQAQPNEIAALGADAASDTNTPVANSVEDESADAESPEVEQAETTPLAETGTQVPAERSSETDVSASVVQVTPMAAVAEISADGLEQLQLNFTDECWLVVTDARGDVLHTDLMQSGQSLNLSGVAPFEVKLGNAQAVQMRLNGEPVDLDATSDTRLMTLAVGD